MGCFPKCFSTCKRRKLKKSVTVNPFKHQSIEVAEQAVQIQPAEAEPTKLEEFIEAIKPSKVSVEEIEEQSKNGDKKKVTFDLNVEANDEETPTKEEVSNVLVEICDAKENEEEARKGIKPNSVVSSMVSPSTHPLNHRYKNCENSEDEDDDCANADEFESSKQTFVEEDSSESLFSLSIDSRKQQVCDDAGTDEKEVNSPMPKQQNGRRDYGRQSSHFQAVSNPIENLAQWKEEVNGKSTPTEASKQRQHQEKENIHTEVEEPDLKLHFSPEPSLKQSKLCERPRTKSSSCVDTSLSSWLVESETTPESNASSKNSVGNKFNSPGSRENRPILGAWTTEELKQLSASSTPKKGSPSPSPEEMPIIGTVGSYWSRTGQAMDSDSGSSCRGRPKSTGKNRPDQKVEWKSTPFKAKLERALEM
ncbi:uncharacterized protein LOC103926521 [Pyrus x bretschneideri]|uniref:uncharacterized protein LOC103926521 n=1 Tax=Pyrus x bretschneideri TaxID=225117 RepID=UPI00203021E9|nr:uncharacterized protein LOC103926521 [Pyrus x bretschneideri]